MKFESIERKLIALIAVALVALAVVSMFFVIYTVEGSMREDFGNKNSLELNSLAKIVGPLIYEYDFNAIERELDVGMGDIDVYYAVVTDEKGNIIRVKSRGDPIPPKNLVEREIAVLYNGETIGSLKMGFSLTRINQKIQRLEQMMALLFLFSFLLLAYLTYSIAGGLIINPINELTEGVKHISRGEFDYKIPLKRKDQFGELTEAFNQMAADLKSKTEEIVESEEKYRTLVDGASDGIVTIDPKANISSWNRGAQEMLGYGAEEVVGKPVSILVPEEQRDEQKEVIMKVKETGFVEGYESIRVGKDGTRIPVEMTISAMRDEGGDVIGLSAIIRDITERKRAEEALQKAHDGLELRVKERTTELEEANIRLQELDKLKSMFIASMSHELRTPLNSIIGFTGIILEGMTGEINKEQRKQLNMVKNSASHLLELINDIIDLSKIEAGKIEPAIEEFDLSGLVQEVKDYFGVATADKDLEMSIEMPKRLIIKSDKRRTKQVLVNLVGNAVKFTDKGGIEIKVVKKDETAEVLVRDTGIGIKSEDMDELFKAFSHIPIKSLPRQEGTGLGLYISKKIAGLLGGNITPESEFGKGSVFIFTLPLNYKRAVT